MLIECEPLTPERSDQMVFGEPGTTEVASAEPFEAAADVSAATVARATAFAAPNALAAAVSAAAFEAAAIAAFECLNCVVLLGHIRRERCGFVR